MKKPMQSPKVIIIVSTAVILSAFTSRLDASNDGVPAPCVLPGKCEDLNIPNINWVVAQNDSPSETVDPASLQCGQMPTAPYDECGSFQSKDSSE